MALIHDFDKLAAGFLKPDNDSQEKPVSNTIELDTDSCNIVLDDIPSVMSVGVPDKGIYEETPGDEPLDGILPPEDDGDYGISLNQKSDNACSGDLLPEDDAEFLTPFFSPDDSM